MRFELKRLTVLTSLFLINACTSIVEQPIVEQRQLEPANVESLTFKLTPDTLESNIRRLLVQHSDYQQIYWNVSKQHRVVANATVKGESLFELVDKVIGPYKQPSQLRATFYQANRVVTFDYERVMGYGTGYGSSYGKLP